jgi:hypothetical protein
MGARLMLLERPPHRWTASQREQYEAYKRAVIKAVFNVERHDSGTWVSSREVYVAFHGHEPGGYPDPIPTSDAAFSCVRSRRPRVATSSFAGAAGVSSGVATSQWKPRFSLGRRDLVSYA